MVKYSKSIACIITITSPLSEMMVTTATTTTSLRMKGEEEHGDVVKDFLQSGRNENYDDIITTNKKIQVEEGEKIEGEGKDKNERFFTNNNRIRRREKSFEENDETTNNDWCESIREEISIVLVYAAFVWWALCCPLWCPFVAFPSLMVYCIPSYFQFYTISNSACVILYHSFYCWFM